MNGRVRRVAAIVVTAGLIGPASAAGAAEDLARDVDPMIGTSPPGFTVPGAVAPHGMTQVSPDTEGEFAYSGYLYTDQLIKGFSLVHLSGPGVRKAGDFPFMPTVGPVVSTDPLANAARFNHATEQASPGEYRVRLDNSGIDVGLTASTRAAIQRYTFPPSPASNVLVSASNSIEGKGNVGKLKIVGNNELVGETKGRYRVFFVARFDRPFHSFGSFDGQSIRRGSRSASGNAAGGYVTFDTTLKQRVQARIGLSFVDVAGARRNLAAESPGFDYAGMRARTRAAWNRELAAIRVSGGTPADRKTFYTALYHSLLHPNVFNDVDRRYRGFDDEVHVARGRTHYANFSSWDLYKSEHQLLALIDPRRFRDMLLSLLADAREGERLPRWGEQNIDASHMSGDPAIPGIVDGYCRGVLADDPAEAAGLYKEAVKLATTERPRFLREKGYLAGRAGTTLEHGVADFSLALMAHALGRGAEAKRWLRQAANYRNVLDPETRFIRPRNADGSWREPFDPTDNVGFQEGNSWQYSWLAPHDAAGLFKRMGGLGVARDRLDHLFSYEAAATTPGVVAEAQSRANVFGLVYKIDQYAPGNEHDIQVPWMYPFAGQPWKTQAVLRQIQFLFRPTPEGLPGNDDLGGLSSWYLFSALGFGPVTPGAPFYVFGSPVFTRAEIRLPDGGSFTVRSPGASLTGKYVRAARLNGKAIGRSWFPHSAIRRGGSLELSMGSEPNTGRTGPVPPSMSDSSLSAFGCRPGTRSSQRKSAKSRIRLSVRPRRVRVGRTVRLRFRATTRKGRRRAVKRATIRFAGERVRTNRRGVAVMSHRFSTTGRFRARASRSGMRSGKARIAAVRRAARPRFTG